MDSSAKVICKGAHRFARLLALLLLLATAPAGSAAVRFDVFLGFDGILPEADWFPVVFEIQNDGPPFTGEVELTPNNFNQGQARSVIVELPTGTTKRLVIPAFAGSRSIWQWNARLLDERGRTRAEQAGLQPRKTHSSRVPLAGAMTRALIALPTLRNAQPDLQPAVARLQPSLFPDSPLALEGLDSIYLSSARAQELKDTQVRALMAWLYSGGHLIVGVEQALHVSGNEWLRRIVPFEFTGSTALEAHPQLHDWLGSDRGADGQLWIEVDSKPRQTANPFASLKPDAAFENQPLAVLTGTVREGRVLIGPPATPLAVMTPRGRGQVTVLTFAPELEPFVSWAHRPQFWAKVFGLPAQLFYDEGRGQIQSWGQSSDGVFGAMIDTEQINKLPVGWLLLLLLGYLAVIGPFDRWWLKKINRQMLTWITFPAYVAFFSLLIYYIGYKLRAGETEYNELHVVDLIQHGEQADWRGRSFATIYSPSNARYDLVNDQPFAAFRSEFMGFYGQDSARIAVEQRGNNFVARVGVPVWTSQLFVGDWWQQAPAPVRFTVARTPDGWSVNAENRLDTPLSPARVVIDGRVFDLGTLPAKQPVTIECRRGGGESLSQFVRSQGQNFQMAAQRRQQAFGDAGSGRLREATLASMAASFLGQIQSENYGQFTSPSRLDLTRLVTGEQAVLLAWVPDYAPVKPMNQFTPRRSRRDTLFRVSTPLLP